MKNNTSKRITQLNKQSRAHLNNYTENLERLNKSPHTIKSYQNDLLQFLEWLQHTQRNQLYQVGQETIGKYLNFLGQGGEYVFIPNSPFKKLFSFFRKI